MCTPVNMYRATFLRPWKAVSETIWSQKVEGTVNCSLKCSKVHFPTNLHNLLVGNKHLNCYPLYLMLTGIKKRNVIRKSWYYFSGLQLILITPTMHYITSCWGDDRPKPALRPLRETSNERLVVAHFHCRVWVGSICKGVAQVASPLPKVGVSRIEPFSSRSTTPLGY